MKDRTKYFRNISRKAVVPIESLPQPVILVSAERSVIAANEKAIHLFGDYEIGKDLSIMIRHPDFLSCVGKTLEDNTVHECEFVRLGRRRRTFHAVSSPYMYTDKTVVGHVESVGAFVAFQETTLASDAERMRSSFVADVSHELRSPLTTLIATLETLKGRAGGDSKTRARFIEIMAHETGRMHRIVDDLLSLALTESHEHILPDEKVNIADIIDAIIQMSAEKAKTRQMTIRGGNCEALPEVRGSYDELYQVLYNLVDNAIKYGDPGSEVTVSCNLGAKNLHVSVHNWGEVIAEEHLPRLTERFYRADKSRSRDQGGTGLGLAIVKHIVNRHQGRLKIKSSENEGTSFTVSLPTDL